MSEVRWNCSKRFNKETNPSFMTRNGNGQLIVDMPKYKSELSNDDLKFSAYCVAKHFSCGINEVMEMDANELHYALAFIELTERQK